MQMFRPFRATVHRHQKYYSQKRAPNETTCSIFNLPRQVIGQRSTLVLNPNIINPQITNKKQSLSLEKNQFLADYQSNLKKTAKKHSVEVMSRKALQKAAYSFIVVDKKSATQKIVRNKSTLEMKQPEKSMAFQTLNILYRTIIETNVRRKPKLRFEVNAKRLPILQKSTINSQILTKRSSQIYVRNSSFDKYKQSLITIQNGTKEKEWMKYNTERALKKGSEKLELQHCNEKSHITARRRRFQHSFEGESRGMNEIVPWNQVFDDGQDEMYE